MMFAVIVITYLKALPGEIFIIIGAIAAMILVPRIVNAFFFKMELTRRRDSLS